MLLSIIIPTLNESNNSFLPKTMEMISLFPQVELIVSDGGSTDNTVELVSNYPRVKLIQTSSNSRAARINAGIKESKGIITLIHHPRTVLAPGAIEYLLKNHQDLTWGGFQHEFDYQHPLLRFTSWYSNNIRPKYGKVVYLDHCIFVRKRFLNLIGPIPEVDIFEDTLFSKALSKSFGAPAILPIKATTSAVRFTTNGIFNQVFKNQILKLGYFFGTGDRVMNQYYEGRDGLNSQYRSK